jgi:SAM-dependent methyltransferase
VPTQPGTGPNGEEDGVNDGPRTWHFGLVARWWAEFNAADPDELAFYQGVVVRDGQPALDLACGAGRLLLPLLRAGLDVDGVDYSPDMLSHCRELAAREGLEPRLYQQAMPTLDLPRAYRTIFICDSFGIGGDRADDAETLRRCYRHLAPDGMLVFSHYLPYDNPERWVYWLPERNVELPQPWPVNEPRRRAANGDELGLSTRLAALDPLAQRETLQIRARLWRDDALVREEEGILVENRYFRDQVLTMLASAGFTDLEVRAGYSEHPATAADTMVVFLARKTAAPQSARA